MGERRADPRHERRLRVLRIYHSAVVTGWRERDRELRRRGVELHVVSPRRWNEGGRDVTLDVSDDDFVVPVGTMGRHPFRFLYDPRPLRRLLRQTAFDVIDVHEEPASLAVAELRLLRRRYRRSASLLLYSAENIHKRYPFPFRWFERRALAEADAVYVANQEAGHVLRRKGFRGIVRHLGLGVDVDRFAPAAVAPPADEGAGIVVGYVGRLDHRKGVQVILDAVSTEPSMALEVVGDGPYRPALEARAGQLGLSARVRFSGFASNAVLAGIYPRFDVVVIPSLPTTDWTEQFCRVAVEAMASGVPVVASRSGALPEVVGDGGLIVPPGDPAALRAALRSLAADPFLRNNLAERARARAQQYSWAAVAEDHRQLYREVVA
ncbi:MAG TPA: glycosyltransferase family 4 protein [Acidimicrobiales bacterium]|nr:glycosyltransferase family 4 protein [Acidimicrobiales bacterium]